MCLLMWLHLSNADQTRQPQILPRSKPKRLQLDFSTNNWQSAFQVPTHLHNQIGPTLCRGASSHSSASKSCFLLSKMQKAPAKSPVLYPLFYHKAGNCRFQHHLSPLGVALVSGQHSVIRRPHLPLPKISAPYSLIPVAGASSKQPSNSQIISI